MLGPALRPWSCGDGFLMLNLAWHTWHNVRTDCIDVARKSRAMCVDRAGAKRYHAAWIGSEEPKTTSLGATQSDKVGGALMDDGQNSDGPARARRVPGGAADPTAIAVCLWGTPQRPERARIEKLGVKLLFADSLDQALLLLEALSVNMVIVDLRQPSSPIEELSQCRQLEDCEATLAVVESKDSKTRVTCSTMAPPWIPVAGDDQLHGCLRELLQNRREPEVRSRDSSRCINLRLLVMFRR